MTDTDNTGLRASGQVMFTALCRIALGENNARTIADEAIATSRKAALATTAADTKVCCDLHGTFACRCNKFPLAVNVNTHACVAVVVESPESLPFRKVAWLGVDLPVGTKLYDAHVGVELASVGDSIAFVCGACGAAHREVPPAARLEGRPAVQTTTTNRPTYLRDKGGEHYLQFDGTLDVHESGDFPCRAHQCVQLAAEKDARIASLEDAERLLRVVRDFAVRDDSTRGGPEVMYHVSCVVMRRIQVYFA